MRVCRVSGGTVRWETSQLWDLAKVSIFALLSFGDTGGAAVSTL